MTPLRQRMIDDMTLHGLKRQDHHGLRRLRRTLRQALRQVSRSLGDRRDPILPALPHP